MNKITEFLEKHVQWLALGLGGLYLIWMVFGYVVSSPVQVQHRNESMTPTQFEEQIRRGPLEQLKLALTPRNVPEFTLEPFARNFASLMGWEGVEPLEFAGRWIASETIRVEVAEPVVAVNTSRDARLPTTLPAAEVVAVHGGMSVVQLPGNVGVAGDGARPAFVAGGPGGMPQGQAGPPQQKDTSWVSQQWTIPTREIVQAFAEAKIPEQQRTTMVLLVEVIREEKTADGRWVNPTPIKPLSNQDPPPFPKAGDKAAEDVYRDWASRNSVSIVQPPFYQVLDGDPWLPPAVAIAQPEPTPVLMPDPRQPTPPTVRPPVDTRPRRTTPTRERDTAPRRDLDRGDRTSPRRPSYAPIDLERLGPLAQARPRTPARGGASDWERQMMEERQRDMERDRLEMERMRREREMEMGVPQQRPGAVGPQPMMPQQMPGAMPGAQVPIGMFNPADMEELVVWAHDDTVQPHHTYRYKMRYYLLNPLYNTRGIAANQQDAEVFAIVSPWSEPTEEITVKSDIEYFVDGGFLNNRVRFVVYKWSGGKWHAKTFEVSPGDMIGDKDGEVDFSTGQTLVMIRSRSEGHEALVTDETGTLVRRDPRSDRNSERWRELRDRVDQTRGVGVGVGVGMLPPPPVR